jgi:hypothetical protein
VVKGLGFGLLSGLGTCSGGLIAVQKLLSMLMYRQWLPDSVLLTCNVTCMQPSNDCAFMMSYTHLVPNTA